MALAVIDFPNSPRTFLSTTSRNFCPTFQALPREIPARRRHLPRVGYYKTSPRCVSDLLQIRCADGSRARLWLERYLPANRECLLRGTARILRLRDVP